MIAGLFLAAAVAAASPSPGPPSLPPAAPTPAPLAPAVVLARYAQAIAHVREPAILTFDYTRDQRGPRTQVQTHRVFRRGTAERDETLSVDGHTLIPPHVTIFRSHRNRYTVAAIAPRPNAYTFRFLKAQRVAHHIDYQFEAIPKHRGRFAISGLTIDGVRFLPTRIEFAMEEPQASGSVTFGRDAAWWLPFNADAEADVGGATQTERLSFYTYRFPPSLPASTFMRSVKRAAPLTGAVPPTLR